MNKAETMLALSEVRDAMTIAMDAVRRDDVDLLVAQLERANEALDELAGKARSAA